MHGATVKIKNGMLCSHVSNTTDSFC